MPPTLSPEYILLALLLIAPGFISVLVAVSLGVIERKISETKLLISSLVSSLIIDTVFISIYQLCGGSVETLSGTQSIFFTPEFRPELVVLILSCSLLLGIIYSIILIFDLIKTAREWLWSKNNHSRHHRQPWEGGLESAHEINIITTDKEIVNGVLSEYSRVGKEKQIVLKDPQWYDRQEEGLVSENEKSVIILEDDIQRLSIITYKDDDS